LRFKTLNNLENYHKSHHIKGEPQTFVSTRKMSTPFAQMSSFEQHSSKSSQGSPLGVHFPQLVGRSRSLDALKSSLITRILGAPNKLEVIDGQINFLL